MVLTLDVLRQHAKLNFHDERCYEVYVQLIEPNIRLMIESYFRDWQDIETRVTALVMKHKGIFKSKNVVLTISEDEVDSTLVDVKEFRRIKRQGFSTKICYLLRHEIISQPMYDVLSHLARIRNKIHDYNGVLTEGERALFSIGANLIHPTYIAKAFEGEKEAWQIEMQKADEAAKEFLKLIKEDSKVMNQAKTN